jgi:hypothetical protein
VNLGIDGSAAAVAANREIAAVLREGILIMFSRRIFFCVSFRLYIQFRLGKLLVKYGPAVQFRGKNERKESN